MSRTFSHALIVGGRGMLGADLAQTLRSDAAFEKVEIADLPELDITDEANRESFFEHRSPDIIFNCAAYTDVDGCESDRERAFAVNAHGAGELAAIAAALGAGFVHVSTDFIFDGSKDAPYAEEDSPNPLSVYGESKLASEQLVALKGSEWIIVRTAWLYGRNGRNLVDTMLTLAREREELAGVTDQIGSPTWTRDLAVAMAVIAKAGVCGVFHAANTGACSRCEQVKFIVECADLSTRVKPVDASSFARAATVPAQSQLDTSKLRRVVGHTMRPWAEALREYVQGLGAGEKR
jgi:dTDP-4-dehydrorhamnose reductase